MTEPIYSFFSNIVLPFIFVFVLTFALMEKINLLNNKAAHMLTALAIAFFFIGVPSLLNITSIIIPVLAILVIIAFCLMLLFGILGIQFYGGEGMRGLKIGIAIVLILIGLIVIASAVGLFQAFPEKLSFLAKPEFIQFISFLLITIVVIVFLVKFQSKGEGKK